MCSLAPPLPCLSLITPPSLNDLFWVDCGGFFCLGGIVLWYTVSDLFACQGDNNRVMDTIVINIDFYKYPLRTYCVPSTGSE